MSHAVNRSESLPTHAKGIAALLPWLGIASLVVLIDQLTKISIAKLFVFGEEKFVTSFFNLVLAYNKGAAFGFLNDQPGWQRYFFTAVAVIAVVVIVYMLRAHAGQRLLCGALALIMGGAIGNAIDRLLYGHVIDFLDFHAMGNHFPAFNVADSAICVGVALFIYDELRRVKQS